MTVSDRADAAAKPTQVTVSNMHIDNGVSTNTEYTILPDDIGSTYVDYRVTPSSETCVYGEIYSTGLAALVLNRRIQLDPLVRCSEVATPRRYKMVFTGDAGHDACLRLMNTAGPCTFVTPTGSPQIQAHSVFKSRTGKAAMTFYFITENPQVNWRLTTDQDANIIGTLTNTKPVEYNGNMTLAEHQGNPGGYVPVVFDIDMRFRITFERVSVTTP
jgi:hypothetical protein